GCSIWSVWSAWCSSVSPRSTSSFPSPQLHRLEPTMNEELHQLLINLKLKAVAARIDEHLSAAERDGTPISTLLTQLLRAEWQARQQAAFAARLKRTQLPETWTLESFPFKLQTGVKERQIRTFAQLDFIPKAENIVFIGETGVGKTGLMSGLVLKAVQNGY